MYYEDFAAAGENGLQEAAAEYHVLGVWHEEGDYEGSIYAILWKDRQYYEYEDSHCSCDGFRFNPRSVTLAYLRNRPVPTYGECNADEYNLVVSLLSPQNEA